MVDETLDDAKALLDGDFGDDRLLRQIRRACENGEAVSNYERSYVRDLATRYLGRHAAPPRDPEPDVDISGSAGPRQHDPYPDVQMPVPTRGVLVPVSGSRRRARRSARWPLVIVIAAVAVAVPAALLLAPSSPLLVQSEYVVSTDSPAYAPNGVIRIDGVSSLAGSTAVVISSAAGEAVWSEEVTVLGDGSYSTLAVAAPGWGAGAFTVAADGGSSTAEFTITG
ncbi:MAG: hypothetical protein MPI95_03040 [Nitrosopumilus sp.]|nr:hypothetical protein [Nitrosopumilus sp.]MDA7943615.1 hypothetical protein [Nitrosopumilus sp.]MDA7952862.1 hypothetical protein [Nitrosopumilus sp.]MDA7958052.1 hypothetical protein [Nitrosopumilus sp.]MDA7960139.1 hypothetical protein [Nitrosopumilus sp.]